MCMVGCLKEAVWEMNREFRSLLCLCGICIALQQSDCKDLNWGRGEGYHPSLMAEL